MKLENERLPEESAETEDENTKTVHLTITSRHITSVPDGEMMSLFTDADAADDENADEDEDLQICGEDGFEALSDEFFSRFTDEITLGEEDDTYIFGVTGKLKKAGDNTLELSYADNESLDGTFTVIRIDAAHPNMVTIMRNGGIVNTIVCEKGVRHISVYDTPVMPFQLAVYTKKCEGAITFEKGGVLELDYMVELRGTDIQRTMLKIEAEVK